MVRKVFVSCATISKTLTLILVFVLSWRQRCPEMALYVSLLRAFLLLGRGEFGMYSMKYSTVESQWSRNR